MIKYYFKTYVDVVQSLLKLYCVVEVGT